MLNNIFQPASNNKKGFVFSISTLFLLLAIVYLVTIYTHYNNRRTEAFTEHIEAHSVVSAYDAIEEGYRKILEAEGTNISVQSGNVTIDIYHTFKFRNAYTKHTDYFATFATLYSPVPAEVNSQGFDLFDLMIEPANITLKTVPPKFKFDVPNNQEPKDYLIGYDIAVIFDDVDTPTIRWKRISEVLPDSPDAMYFKIAGQGQNGTISDKRWISKDDYSEVHLKNADGHSLIAIKKLTDGGLEYHYQPHLNMRLKTTLILNTNSARVVFEHGSIEIIGITATKKGKIIIG